ALAELAGDNADAIMPGYTHLQRAQPVSFGHYMCAYAEMLLRDSDRLQDCMRRLNVSPLGSGALAGTTYETDRHLTAALLGFDAPCENSLDGVSDRDFALELMSALSILMMHISRLSEEMILWASLEFRFIELSDAYSTGSSIMPQKKNPDLCELARGKTGRVYGDLFTLLTVMKGLPLAYNKDMQEDKEALFDAVDTVRGVLCVFPDMLRTMRIRRENMRAAAGAGFINATDCADYLVKKGMPFRTAYKIVGEIVGECTQNGKTLESMSLADYQSHSELFGEDVYDAINLENCLALRRSYGGPAPENVRAAVERLKGRIHVAAAAFGGEE
ncbi:MAG: argininosuccinate lyase, partial [Clostridia bacterium]|nr:argininosuccinate lyase [Clostridia bacterium]